jgi:hypothetical protein
VTQNYIIQDDKRATEITSLNETELIAWVPGSSGNPSTDAWLRGDDAGGAIAALGWLDENDSPEARLYCVVGGGIHEIVCSPNSCWTGREI